MSKLSVEIKRIAPKKSKKTRALLIDLDHMPEAFRWLERQAHVHGCSKTAYVKALIEVDRKEKEGE